MKTDFINDPILRQELASRRRHLEIMDSPGIYFIWAPVVNLIKVGVTTRPLAVRVAAIRQASPIPVFLIGAWTRATPRMEEGLHKEFASYRVRGEWFQAKSVWYFVERRVVHGVRLMNANPLTLEINGETHEAYEEWPERPAPAKLVKRARR